MKLCTCNNCGGIFEDMNPQVDAKEYPDVPGIEPIVKMPDEEDDDRYVEYWACPKCLTDGYLKDGLGIADYQPENADPGEVCTEDDFISAAKGNLHYAVLLRQRVSWQHPQTLVDEDLREGEIEKVNDTYKLVN